MLAPNNNYSGQKLIPKVNVEVACCSDPTSDGQISVHKCHPWIGNADTHST